LGSRAGGELHGRGLHRSIETRERHGVEVVNAAGAQSEFSNNRGAEPPGRLLIAHAQSRAALDDRFVEQALRGRHPHQGADLAAAARLTEYRDVVRISAEALGVVAHPLEQGDDVEHADVAGPGVALAPDFREVEIAERIQPVVVGDQHDVVPSRQIGSIVRRQTAG